MSLIEWSDALSVGYAEIDEDHKKLVVMVNDLNDAVLGGKEQSTVEGILEELLEYTGWHFRHEERLMQQSEYPGYFEHKKEHENLVTQAVDLFKKYQDGDESVPGLLMPFLKDWLTNHILGTDMKTGAYLAAQG